MAEAIDTRRNFEGRLPASAPLANPYVPFQLENPEMYHPEDAIAKGTLFPGLDLPFMGKTNMPSKDNSPLFQLQTIAFVLQELALYLDTHKDDKEAFSVFQSFRKLYAKSLEDYEKNYGPITLYGITGDQYNWLDKPWPWEYMADRRA